MATQGLIGQVKYNCDVSDARFWGLFSLCGLLLRLRELYLSEHGLRPWHRVRSQEMGPWIARKEALWEELSERDFRPLRIGGRSFGPFDTQGINRALSGRGLLYGAGYGIHRKPTFFLAQLKRQGELQGLRFYVLGRELARDLAASPAMLSQGAIIGRLEVAEQMLWSAYQEFEARPQGALKAAFGFYGVEPGQAPEVFLPRVAEAELETYLWHEVGEAREGQRLGPDWRELVSTCGLAKGAQLLDALKDTLADTCPEGMLSFIIRRERAGSLAFFLYHLRGPRARLCKALQEACRAFLAKQDWAMVEQARGATYQGASQLAQRLLRHYRQGSTREAILRELQDLR